MNEKYKAKLSFCKLFRIILDRMTMHDLSELVSAMGYDSFKSKSSPTRDSNRSPVKQEPSTSTPPGTPLHHPVVEIKQEPPDIPLQIPSSLAIEDDMMMEDDFTSSDLGW